MAARNLHSRVRLALVGGVLLVSACLLAAQPEPEPNKKPADPPKAAPKLPPLLKLLDGTLQWPAPLNANDPERVLISPLELQKLHDQIEQLKKQAASGKAVAPSGCAVRASVELRGETPVAVLRAVYTFRTSVPNTVVALGGKRGFLVSATLDGRRGFLGAAVDAALGKHTVAVPETTDDGFAVLIETAGPHTLVLDLEAPVSGRAKTEIGFELGLPRAAITTLVLNPPNGVGRVNVMTRTPDPGPPAKPPETRRLPALDVKQLAPRPESHAGFPLGPIDSLEVTWEPPAAAAQPNDAVISAEWDVACKLTDRSVETEAKVRPRGNARTWRFALPKGAELAASRAAREPTDVGPVLLPTVTRPADPNAPIWSVEIPAGSTAADWVFTATQRQDRVKPADPGKPTPIPVGPFAALGVARQTGTVRVTTAGSVRYEFEHATELRRTPVIEPPDSATTELLFQFATGPTGNAVPPALLQVKTFPVAGALRVKPTYRLNLTPTAWQVEADLLVTPVRAEVTSVVVEIPASWRSLVAEPVELVEGLLQEEKADGPRRTATIQLAGAQRRPFELKLRASVPLGAGDAEAAVPLPRFPSMTPREGKIEVSERDASVIAVVSSGLEVRATGREWEGNQAATWGTPLTATASADGKAGRSVTGRFEHGVARVDLAWQPHRSEVTADVRAEVTIERRQVRVSQTIRFRGPGALPRSFRLRGPATVAGLKAEPALQQSAPGEWFTGDGVELPDGVMRLEFAVPIPRAGSDDRGPWTVPVPLFWPADVTRTETTTRIWTATDGVQLDDVQSPGWRDLPPEPGRQVLPAATMVAAGSDATLTLRLRDADVAGRASVWVSRGLIRVRTRDVGPTEYEARFLVHRWLADSLDIRIPGPLAGEHPEVLVDGTLIDANVIPDPNGSGSVIVRVPLPESRDQPVEIEVKYRLATERGGVETFEPPQLRGAAFDGPVRWQVTLPNGAVPLLTDGGSAEQRWTFSSGLLLPTARRSAASLEEWFRTGNDADDQQAGAIGDLVVRQPGPAAIRVAAVSRTRLALACSVAVFVLGFGLSRLRGSIAGPVVALVGGLAAAAAVRLPQPAAMTAAAAEPGLAALALVLVGLALARWRARRRVTYLPGFARVHVEHAAAPATANGTGSVRKPQLGSTGSNGAASEPHPMAPSGSRPDH